MSREVVWTRRKYDLLCEQGMLSDDDRDKLERHIKLETNQQIATRYNVDVSVINADIKRYKTIYDAVQKEFPDVLERRNMSVYRKKKHHI